MAVLREDTDSMDEDMWFEKEAVDGAGGDSHESGSESEEDEDVKLDQPSKEVVYNREGLLDKLEDISWPGNVPWINSEGKALGEKKKIEEAEERKKAREAKKLAKEVQAQKQKERAKQKKEEIESVKKWRKQRQQSGFKGGDEEETAEGGKQGGRKTTRREFRDSKFGQGGKKGMRKQNTADTTDDLRGFNQGRDSGNKKRKR
ncbi:hypothetical protein MLD38_008931 [Melastoma candidum]|uniref:Uncharacterized protein n=1 Tax=Melastoma candidum TaxID=119954 RepID=A0ACB9RVX2_9MYRT|nr:hypothetical protein MLD38_008931 [Melastoma candidum]